MELLVNGRPTTLPADATVEDVLKQFSLVPQRVAIEVNEQLVRRSGYAQTRLRPGDRVEIVTLVGGG
jgi:thiamine biosynthesis protein ThiS